MALQGSVLAGEEPEHPPRRVPSAHREGEATARGHRGPGLLGDEAGRRLRHGVRVGEDVDLHGASTGQSSDDVPAAGDHVLGLLRAPGARLVLARTGVLAWMAGSTMRQASSTQSSRANRKVSPVHRVAEELVVGVELARQAVGHLELHALGAPRRLRRQVGLLDGRAERDDEVGAQAEAEVVVAGAAPPRRSTAGCGAAPPPRCASPAGTCRPGCRRARPASASSPPRAAGPRRSRPWTPAPRPSRTGSRGTAPARCGRVGWPGCPSAPSPSRRAPSRCRGCGAAAPWRCWRRPGGGGSGPRRGWPRPCRRRRRAPGRRSPRPW